MPISESVRPDTPAVDLVGILEGHHGVRALGNRRAGHDPYRRTLLDPDGGKLARSHRTRDPEGDRRGLGCSPDVLGPEGVPVHGRVVQRGYVEPALHILGQHLPVGLEDRPRLGLQHAKVAEDALPRLLDADHRLVLMSVNVLYQFGLVSYSAAAQP